MLKKLLKYIKMARKGKKKIEEEEIPEEVSDIEEGIPEEVPDIEEEMPQSLDSRLNRTETAIKEIIDTLEQSYDKRMTVSDTIGKLREIRARI